MSERRLSRTQWARVLDHANQVAADMGARRKHFMMEGWSEKDLVSFDQSSNRYIRERIEVHIGTISLLRHGRRKEEVSILAPHKVRQGLETLIGRRATEELLGER